MVISLLSSNLSDRGGMLCDHIVFGDINVIHSHQRARRARAKRTHHAQGCP